MVLIDSIFKNRRLPATPQKRSRRNLERHFALVHTIQAQKDSPDLPFWRVTCKWHLQIDPHTLEPFLASDMLNVVGLIIKKHL